MKNTYYQAVATSHGLEKDKIYFEGEDGKILIEGEKRVPAFPMIWKRVLIPIPIYEGILKKGDETPRMKKEIIMGVSDGMGYEEMEVSIEEIHEFNKGKSLVCLAKIPCENGMIQLNIPNLYVR